MAKKLTTMEYLDMVQRAAGIGIRLTASPRGTRKSTLYTFQGYGTIKKYGKSDALEYLEGMENA